MDGFCDLEEEGQRWWQGPWFCFLFFLWWVVVAIVVLVTSRAMVGVLIWKGCSTSDGGFGWTAMGLYCIEYINLLGCLSVYIKRIQKVSYCFFCCQKYS